jgi:hypothetical protein
MATPSAPTTWTVVREVLSANLNLTADEVILKAKAKGVKAPDDVIRRTVYDVKKKLKQKAGTPATKAQPASKPVPAPKAAPAAAPTSVVGVPQVLSNVALVNAAVVASGGVEQAKRVAEAVRACGGVDAFAHYLDLVAGIRHNGA